MLHSLSKVPLLKYTEELLGRRGTATAVPDNIATLERLLVDLKQRATPDNPNAFGDAIEYSLLRALRIVQRSGGTRIIVRQLQEGVSVGGVGQGGRMRGAIKLQAALCLEHVRIHRGRHPL